mgnify:FL=1
MAESYQGNTEFQPDFESEGEGAGCQNPALIMPENENISDDAVTNSWNEQIISFFDRMAPEWDRRMVKDDAKINLILDAAGVKKGSVVLDVACGTGILFPYFLERNVSHVIGVDISPGMAHIAAGKFQDPRIEVICGNIETIPVRMLCDCCVIYNALPHFENPQRLVSRLVGWLNPGGRLTVAHGMGLEALQRHHAGQARNVSRRMPSADELAQLLSPWLSVDVRISDNEKYIVSGIVSK